MESIVKHRIDRSLTEILFSGQGGTPIGKNNDETRHLPQSTEPSSFWTASMHQVKCCFADSVNILSTGDATPSFKLWWLCFWADASWSTACTSRGHLQLAKQAAELRTPVNEGLWITLQHLKKEENHLCPCLGILQDYSWWKRWDSQHTDKGHKEGAAEEGNTSKLYLSNHQGALAGIRRKGVFVF